MSSEKWKSAAGGGGAAAIIGAATLYPDNAAVAVMLEAVGFVLVGVLLTMVIVDWHRSRKDDGDDVDR